MSEFAKLNTIHCPQNLDQVIQLGVSECIAGTRSSESRLPRPDKSFSLWPTADKSFESADCVD